MAEATAALLVTSQPPSPAFTHGPRATGHLRPAAPDTPVSDSATAYRLLVNSPCHRLWRAPVLTIRSRLRKSRRV